LRELICGIDGIRRGSASNACAGIAASSNGESQARRDRRGERAVFAYGFAKSDRANIDADEEKPFQEAARHVLRLTEKQIDELLKNGDFVEVKYEEEISK
jgi:hypothetical protein